MFSDYATNFARIAKSIWGQKATILTHLVLEEGKNYHVVKGVEPFSDFSRRM